ncbi:MAG: pirin family protein [Chitinophagaceae bacterium]|nr:MAG: pirin family protein [Chitinophagaceae bacterium]
MDQSIKQIQWVISPPAPHMVGNGFRVHSFFPNNIISKKRMSPFFLMDYNAKMEFTPREEPRGVGVHPHRGFETVSIVYHGSVAHNDSAGNSGVIREGDVQWMTAASGLLHKEYHEEEFSKRGGVFQMVQLWVNLPAQYKMMPPKYQEISNQMMGKYFLPGDKGVVEIIAGDFNEVRGAASTFTPMHVYNARLRKDASLDLSFPSFYNTGILVVEGNVTINDTTAPADHFIVFKNEGETIHISASEDAVLLVLSGEPIDEPIAQSGPFLMNTWEEVEQAIRDVSLGKFGTLDE